MLSSILSLISAVAAAPALEVIGEPNGYINVNITVESANNTLNGRGVHSLYDDNYAMFVYGIYEGVQTHLLGKDNDVVYEAHGLDWETGGEMPWTWFQISLFQNIIIGTYPTPYNNPTFKDNYLAINGSTECFYACTDEVFNIGNYANSSSHILNAYGPEDNVPDYCQNIKLRAVKFE